MQALPNILLVDDDRELADITKEYLVAKGMDVDLTYDATSALELFKKETYDICILDVKMPMKDGFTLAKELRELDSKVSIIFLTGQKDKADRITGLLLGADDYVTKPFSMQELFLRVNNIYRRLGFQKDDESIKYKLGLYTYDSVSRKLSIGDTVERLSEMEGQLLILFCNQPNKRITREQALNQIWQDEDHLKSRSLSVYINKLRHRLKGDDSIEILNVYGSGYQLVLNN